MSLPERAALDSRSVMKKALHEIAYFARTLDEAVEIAQRAFDEQSEVYARGLDAYAKEVLKR